MLQDGPILPDPATLPKNVSGAGGPFALPDGTLPIEYFRVLDILAKTPIQTSPVAWQSPGYYTKPLLATYVRTTALTATWIDILTFQVPDRHVAVVQGYTATIAGDMTITPVQFRLKRLKASGTGDFAVDLAPGTGIDRFKDSSTDYPAKIQPISIIADQQNPVIIQARYPAGASVRLLCALTGTIYKTNELFSRGPLTGGGNW